MTIDKNKILKLFRVKLADIIKGQVQEIKELSQDSASKGNYGSGPFLKANIDLYEKHLKEKLKILIETTFEVINEQDIISQKDEKEILNIFKDYVQGEILNKQNSIKALMASSGFNQPAIRTAHNTNLASILNEELRLKVDYIHHLIEQHNHKAIEQKKNRRYIDSKTITAFGTGVLAIVALLTFLYSIGLFSNEDDYLKKIPIVEKFELSDSEILLGSSITISWNVSNVDSVLLNNGIGSVLSSGSRSITPMNSTPIKLSAFLSNTEIVVTKSIIVKDSLGTHL